MPANCARRAGRQRGVAGVGSRPVETAVFVIVGLVVLVFAFVLGALGRERTSGDREGEAARLAAELEVERRRVHELQAELDRRRGAEGAGG